MPDQLTHELDCELVIGLVAAVGTDVDQVTSLLTGQLELAGYQSEVIHISSDVLPPLVNVPDQWPNKYERYSQLMTFGNEARAAACQTGGELARNGDAVLAYGAAANIFLKRPQESGNSLPFSKKAFIVRQLKRPEEVEALRFIYPQGFVLVGIHAEEDRRRSHLVDDLGMTSEQANELIRRDSEEMRVAHGQRVNRTFHLADFFVHASNDADRLRSDIRRMVELWFGCPFHTPTFDEFAMYFAFSAALRSADLSRQVGAVVTKDNQILSTGANECPSAGGGLYWPHRKDGEPSVHDVPAGRDYMRGYDSNRAQQLAIIREIVDRGIRDFELDENKLNELLAGSGIGDLTEYGRVVHAEMEALLACGRNGVSTKGTDLYCTTFPCHNCAKHIIAAGVKRLVFIEPYSKSKALHFHDEAIVTGTKQEDKDGRVLFQPFVGIGPRRYFDLFSMQLGSSYDLVRKESATGKKTEWSIQNARLRIQMKPASYLELEKDAIQRFSAYNPRSTSKES